MSVFFKTLKEYLENASIHGFRFLAEPNRHIIERIFWFVFIILSWIGTYLFMYSAYDSYTNNAISFTVDADYLHFDTEFPSISFCELNAAEKILSKLKRVYPNDEIKLTPSQAYDIVNYGKFSNLKSCLTNNVINETYCRLPNDSLHDISIKGRTPCKSFFVKCKWNEEEFDCCTYFLPFFTDSGICYSINNLQTEKVNGARVKYDMISNYTTGPGALTVIMSTNSRVFWHSAEDIPDLKSGQDSLLSVKLMTSKRFNVLLKVLHTTNEPAVRDLPFEQRNCLFPEENYLKFHKYYSRTACVVECRRNEQIKLCNCSSHFLPPLVTDDSTCDLGSYVHCIGKYMNKWKGLRAEWNTGDALYCPCEQTCIETDVTMDDDINDKTWSNPNKSALITIGLKSVPSMRLQRTVIRGPLDMVVSMGGTAGLFMGASLLSFVELFYFFTLRLYANIRKARSEKKLSKHKAAILARKHTRTRYIDY